MPNFLFDTEFAIGNGTEIILRSTDDALDFVRRLAKQRPNTQWELVRRRLDAVKTEQDAKEAAGALRELLNSEALLRAETVRT
jgi:hypothetical protein